MTPALRFFIALTAIALAAASPAKAPLSPVEGLYVARIMETASALRLTADGRFEWMFSTGALDLSAAGRWVRGPDGVLRLNSDPPVVAPGFELIGKTRSKDRGVRVRIADQKGKTPAHLGAIALFRDGGTTGGNFEDGEHYFEPDPARPIAAIRVETMFGTQSERHEVAPGDVISFRFHPNDLGRADFSDVRVSEEGDALSFTWQGMPLRYVREDEDRTQP